MGWKTSMILVNSKQEFDISDFFASLGYYELEKSEKKSFEQVMNPDDDKIYVGQYKGNTIICMQDIPLESMDESMSRAENLLSKIFQNTDIVSFALHSVVNLWGYSVARNGAKLRVRVGSAEGGTMVEHGEILEAEKDLFSKSILNSDGERVFVFDDVSEEEYSDDQVGENFVFDISEKYLGEPMDGCDELFATEFQGYNFSKSKPKSPIVEQKKAPEVIKSKKPWWKFW